MADRILDTQRTASGNRILDSQFASGGGGVGTLISEPFRDSATGPVLAGLNIENVLVLAMDRSTVLSLANQVTDGEGRLVIAHSSIVAGTLYMLCTFNADGTIRGLKRYTAA